MKEFTTHRTTRWEPVEWADIRPGDRIAPLASWTLDVVNVEDGVIYALNHDTGQVGTYRTPMTGVYRLVRDA